MTELSYKSYGAKLDLTDDGPRSSRSSRGSEWVVKQGSLKPVKESPIRTKETTASTAIKVKWSKRYTTKEFFQAVTDGRADFVRDLIDRGADVDIVDINGNTPLHRAVAVGHIDVVKLLIDKGADVNAKDNDGWTALRWAAIEGHLEIVKLLIDQGATVNAQDENGWTALHRAAIGGHTDTIKLLINCGAEVNAEDNDGWTPLHWAAIENQTETVKLLRQHRVTELQESAIC